MPSLRDRVARPASSPAATNARPALLPCSARAPIQSEAMTSGW